MVAGALIGAPLAADAGLCLNMSVEDAREALVDRKLSYENGAWQEFLTSGRTLYNAGSDSWGYWELHEDTGSAARYCSQWPPNGDWDCYDLCRTSGPERIHFLDDYGNSSVGTYAD